MNTYYVYILANWNDSVIYVGMTNDLERRLYEHQHKLVKGFTEKYNVNKLVYFEETDDVCAAIEREKEIKKENYYCSERSFGTVQRSIRLPEGVKQDQIKASYKNGVLEIEIPKGEEAKPKGKDIELE